MICHTGALYWQIKPEKGTLIGIQGDMLRNYFCYDYYLEILQESMISLIYQLVCLQTQNIEL